MTLLRACGAFLLLGIAFAGTGFSGCASRESVPEVPPPARTSFDSARVARGAQLAALGNCASCHTAPGGKPYAGGRALKTPFGTVYGTNITPEPDTGIGRWSEAAFARAMREGVDRAGRHLYPAFPYDHFTRLTDEDLGALYAFVMTRDPVRAETPSDRIPVPRAAVGVWNSMYLEPGAYRPDASKSAQWNRGAYLVQGLAHCGACHTPRNTLGAERKAEAFSGGESEGWHAPALDAASPSPVPWTAESLYTYLRTGIARAHAQTAGPMADVVRNLGQASEEDVRAIAVYVALLDTRSEQQREAQGREALSGASARAATGSADARSDARGAAIYAGACEDCHDRGRDAEGGALPLPLATGLTMPTPRNLIRIIRDGIVPREGERARWMPGFGGALSDDQLADLVTYLRSLTGRPPWQDVAADVRNVVRGKE